MPRPKPYCIKLLEALDGSDLTLAERGVLLAQFRFADHSNGRNSFVGENRLAEYLNTSVATVRRSRRALRTKGWLIERKRGRHGSDKDFASIYEVVIPAVQSVAAQKPKRRARNPHGLNQYTAQEVTRDLCQEVKQTSNPSSQEVTRDHPSRFTNPCPTGDGYEDSITEATQGMASREVSDDEVVGLSGNPKASTSLTTEPLDSRTGAPKKLPPGVCINCGCDENDPWGAHAPDCPDNPANFLKY